MRQVELAGFRHHPMLVVGNGHFCHRASQIAPVGDQLVQSFGIDDRARQDMGTDFRTFFKDADAGIRRFLFDADGGGKASWSGADNYDVIWHRFPFTHRLCPLPRLTIGPSCAMNSWRKMPCQAIDPAVNR